MDKSDENYAYVLFSKNLKKYRMEAGLTQEQLSIKSGYALSFIKKIEAKSVHQTCSIGTAYGFAKALNIPLSKLFEDVGEVEDEK